MDSTLVVFYSYTGVSRIAAQLLASHHGWPVGEIFDASERTYLRSVCDSFLRRHPDIRYEGPDPGDFRTVVLVSPIWAYRLAGPMRTFVTQQRERLQRVAVVSTMGGAGASNAVGEIGRILGRPPVAADAFTQASIEDGSSTARLIAFGDALQTGMRVPPAAIPAHT